MTNMRKLWRPDNLQAARHQHATQARESMNFHPLKESKLVTFRNVSIQALWFGESFGLVPESLQVHKEICEGIMQRNADTTTVSVVVASDKQNMLQTVFTPPIWSYKQPLLSWGSSG